MNVNPRLSKFFVLLFMLVLSHTSNSIELEKSTLQNIEFPVFQPEKKNKGNILPPVPMTSDTHGQDLSAGEAFQVKGFQFEGNTILSDQELTELGQVYLQRPVTLSDLSAFRDRITRVYLKKGYMNSGALLSAPAMQEGIVNFRIVEGVLSDIRISSDGHLNASYVLPPLRKAAGSVVNVFKLEEELQLLQQDVLIKRIDARLEPTGIQGQAVLNVDVTENLPYDFVAEINNHYSPNIGSEGIRLIARHDNLSGSGDQMSALFEKTPGYLKGSFRYVQPFSRTTSVDVSLSASKSQVLERRFRELDIKDLSQSLNVSYVRSHFLNLRHRFDWSASAFYQHGQTYLLGEPFSFDVGRDDGEISVQGLGLESNWSVRKKNQVLAIGLGARFSFALPDDDDDADELVIVGAPDGQAVVINSNIQWAKKFQLLNVRLFTRMDFQVSNASLYGIQQFSLGGSHSVRGYRENLILRDNGLSGSVELRLPVLLSAGTSVSLAAFADGGTAWQSAQFDKGTSELASVGTGIVASMHRNTHVSAYWGKALNDVSHSGLSNMQDQGIHFSIRSHWR